METKTCLYPECANPVDFRGLCRNHYQSAHRYVSMGRVTWEQLETAGKCLAPKFSHSELRSNWFTEAVDCVDKL